jgi:RHS repeat-associated protein
MMTRDQFADAREFIYTAGDERLAVHTTSSNSWQWTLRDMEHRPLRDYTSQGGPHGTASFTWMKDYIWRGNRILASLQPQGLAKTTYHYHVDNLGTPRRITDSNDNTVGFHDYYAFGAEAYGKDEPALTRLKFTGHERDSTGDVFGTLDYMHARYYSPTVGRFLSVDPAMNMKKTVPNPQMWNRYAYVVNNPILYTDPDGREHVIEPGFTKPMTAENLDLDTAPWYIKASFRIPGEILMLGAGDLAIGGLRGVFAMARYTAQERMVLREAATILRSQALKDAVAALKAGKDGATFVVGRYEIVVSTELEAAAMTFRGMNGQTTFLLGRQALTSNMELIKTVLHETFRLLMTPAGVASAEGAAAATKAAFDFAEMAAWFFRTIRILP